MLKLKLENIIRNESGGHALHVLVYDDAAPEVILTRISVPLASQSEADQQATVAQVKTKLNAWKTKQSGKDVVKAAIQAKLDGLN